MIAFFSMAMLPRAKYIEALVSNIRSNLHWLGFVSPHNMVRDQSSSAHNTHRLDRGLQFFSSDRLRNMVLLLSMGNWYRPCIDTTSTEQRLSIQCLNDDRDDIRPTLSYDGSRYFVGG